MKKVHYIGMDMGDQNHDVCVLDAEGRVVRRDRVRNTAQALKAFFAKEASGTPLVLEAGTHSGWVSRLLSALGLKVVVAQPRALKALWSRNRKNDESDAELLARMLRADPQLLCPIEHRGEAEQTDLLSLRARDVLVQARTRLVNAARGLAKAMGHRLPPSDARCFATKARVDLPLPLQDALHPLLDMVAALSDQIHALDRAIEQIAQTRYPQTQQLRAVAGVGPITSLAYVLTLADPTRFHRSRDVGPYLGLIPKQDQSGQIDKQLHITKAGDTFLRRLLVGSAQYILGPFGPDCALRTAGVRLAARGGKNAKRRAVVAVARKLAVLLHKLWVSQEPYDPQRGLAPQPQTV